MRRSGNPAAEGPSGIGSAGDTRILAYAEHRRTALVWRVAGDATVARCWRAAGNVPRQNHHPKGIVGNDRERGIVGLVRQAQQGVPELARRVQL